MQVWRRHVYADRLRHALRWQFAIGTGHSKLHLHWEYMQPPWMQALNWRRLRAADNDKLGSPKHIRRPPRRPSCRTASTTLIRSSTDACALMRGKRYASSRSETLAQTERGLARVAVSFSTSGIAWADLRQPLMAGGTCHARASSRACAMRCRLARPRADQIGEGVLVEHLDERFQRFAEHAVDRRRALDAAR